MLRANLPKNNKSFERIGISVLNFIQCATPTNAGLNKKRPSPFHGGFMVSESYLFLEGSTNASEEELSFQDSKHALWPKAILGNCHIFPKDL